MGWWVGSRGLLGGGDFSRRQRLDHVGDDVGVRLDQNRVAFVPSPFGELEEVLIVYADAIGMELLFVLLEIARELHCLISRDAPPHSRLELAPLLQLIDRSLVRRAVEVREGLLELVADRDGDGVLPQLIHGLVAVLIVGRFEHGRRGQGGTTEQHDVLPNAEIAGVV